MPAEFPLVVDRAMVRAAVAHRDQVRKSSNIPYIIHPALVALLLQREGFNDEVLAAAILHDVLEDTAVTEAELRAEFGERIVELVLWASETKKDAAGRPIPWELRKQAKVEKLRKAPGEARAIVLADLLHNLHACLEDLRAGVNVWQRFNASREPWLANARAVIKVCAEPSGPLGRLAAACRETLDAIQAF
jgi:(p)ppGpp synthase/HD superfamily hydrolase